jgi:uncharacterized protein YbaR (Trm112 family)
MRVLAPSDCLADLICPACRSDRLRADESAIVCENCERAFPCRRGVADYVIPDQLDASGARRRAANAVELDSEKAVRRRLRRATAGNPLVRAQTRRSMRVVDKFMSGYGRRWTLVSLGSGPGFELPLLFERHTFARVYSSDIAWSSTSLVPQIMHCYRGELGLFAADFEHIPLTRRDDLVGFVFLALHRAADPHRSLAAMLEQTFDHLVLVEPLSNPLVELLDRVRLACVPGYRATCPQRLQPRRMQEIAREHGFEMRMETWWEVPRWMLPRRVRKSRYGWVPLFLLGEAVSRALRERGLGTMAAVHFRRPAGAYPGRRPT